MGGSHVGSVLIDAPSKFAVLTVKEEAPSHCLVQWLIPKKVSTQSELIHYQFANVLYITFKLYDICNIFTTHSNNTYCFWGSIAY